MRSKTRQSPTRAVLNVSLDWADLDVLRRPPGEAHPVLYPARWLADAADPDHGGPDRQALAEAVALVGYGRSPADRSRTASSVTKRL